MPRSTPARLLLGLCLFGCSPEDDQSDVADEAATDEAATDGSEGTETSDDPLEFPPVECGEITCAEGLLCVVPGAECDDSQDPPGTVYPPPECMEVPSECLSVNQFHLDDCLDAAFCLPSWDETTPNLIEGKFRCGNPVADCQGG